MEHAPKVEEASSGTSALDDGLGGERRDIVERLRDTPNWLRESWGDWKACTTKYDRAPKEAADEIERLRNLLRRGTQQLAAWQEKYGEHNPEWLPPAGDVRWMEDVSTGLGATSFIDYQQRAGAPLTFFTQIACNAYAAAATRDDVSHYDAMRVALQALEDAMQHKTPNAGVTGAEPQAERPR